MDLGSGFGVLFGGIDLECGLGVWIWGVIWGWSVDLGCGFEVRYRFGVWFGGVDLGC